MLQKKRHDREAAEQAEDQMVTVSPSQSPVKTRSRLLQRRSPFKSSQSPFLRVALSPPSPSSPVEVTLPSLSPTQPVEVSLSPPSPTPPAEREAEDQTETASPSQSPAKARSRILQRLSPFKPSLLPFRRVTLSPPSPTPPVEVTLPSLSPTQPVNEGGGQRLKDRLRRIGQASEGAAAALQERTLRSSVASNPVLYYLRDGGEAVRQPSDKELVEFLPREDDKDNRDYVLSRKRIDFDAFADSVDDKLRSSDSTQSSTGICWDEESSGGDSDASQSKNSSPLGSLGVGILRTLPTYDDDARIRPSAAQLQTGLTRRAADMLSTELGTASASVISSCSVFNVHDDENPAAQVVISHLSQVSYFEVKPFQVFSDLKKKRLRNSSKYRVLWRQQLERQQGHTEVHVFWRLLQHIETTLALAGEKERGGLSVVTYDNNDPTERLVTTIEPTTSIKVSFSCMGQVPAALNQVLELRGALHKDSNASTLQMASILMDAVVQAGKLCSHAGPTSNSEIFEVKGASCSSALAGGNYVFLFDVDASRSITAILAGLTAAAAAAVGHASIVECNLEDWCQVQVESLSKVAFLVGDRLLSARDSDSLFNTAKTEQIRNEIAHINDYTTALCTKGSLTGVGIGTKAELGEALRENSHYLEARGITTSVAGALEVCKLVCGDSDAQLGMAAVKLCSEGAQIRRGNYDAEGNRLANYLHSGGTSDKLDHAEGRVAGRETVREEDDSAYTQSVNDTCSYIRDGGRAFSAFDNMHTEQAIRAADGAGKTKNGVVMTAALVVKQKPGYVTGDTKMRRLPRVGVDHLLLSSAGDQPPLSFKSHFQQMQSLIRKCHAEQLHRAAFNRASKVDRRITVPPMGSLAGNQRSEADAAHPGVSLRQPVRELGLEPLPFNELTHDGFCRVIIALVEILKFPVTEILESLLFRGDDHCRAFFYGDQASYGGFKECKGILVGEISRILDQCFAEGRPAALDSDPLLRHYVFVFCCFYIWLFNQGWLHSEFGGVDLINRMYGIVLLGPIRFSLPEFKHLNSSAFKVEDFQAWVRLVSYLSSSLWNVMAVNFMKSNVEALVAEGSTMEVWMDKYAAWQETNVFGCVGGKAGDTGDFSGVDMGFYAASTYLVMTSVFKVFHESTAAVNHSTNMGALSRFFGPLMYDSGKHLYGELFADYADGQGVASSDYLHTADAHSSWVAAGVNNNNEKGANGENNAEAADARNEAWVMRCKVPHKVASRFQTEIQIKARARREAGRAERRRQAEQFNNINSDGESNRKGDAIAASPTVAHIEKLFIIPSRLCERVENRTSLTSFFTPHASAITVYLPWEVLENMQFEHLNGALHYSGLGTKGNSFSSSSSSSSSSQHSAGCTLLCIDCPSCEVSLVEVDATEEDGDAERATGNEDGDEDATGLETFMCICCDLQQSSDNVAQTCPLCHGEACLSCSRRRNRYYLLSLAEVRKVVKEQQKDLPKQTRIAPSKISKHVLLEYLDKLADDKRKHELENHVGGSDGGASNAARSICGRVPGVGAQILSVGEVNTVHFQALQTRTGCIGNFVARAAAFRAARVPKVGDDDTYTVRLECVPGIELGITATSRQSSDGESMSYTVAFVSQGSEAYSKGVEIGDVFVSVNEKVFKSFVALTAALSACGPRTPLWCVFFRSPDVERVPRPAFKWDSTAPLPVRYYDTGQAGDLQQTSCLDALNLSGGTAGYLKKRVLEELKNGNAPPTMEALALVHLTSTKKDGPKIQGATASKRLNSKTQRQAALHISNSPLRLLASFLRPDDVLCVAHDTRAREVLTRQFLPKRDETFTKEARVLDFIHDNFDAVERHIDNRMENGAETAAEMGSSELELAAILAAYVQKLKGEEGALESQVYDVAKQRTGTDEHAVRLGGLYQRLTDKSSEVAEALARQSDALEAATAAGAISPPSKEGTALQSDFNGVSSEVGSHSAVHAAIAHTQEVESIIEALGAFSQEHRRRFEMLHLPIAPSEVFNSTEICKKIVIVARIFDRGPSSVWETGSSFVASWIEHCGGTVYQDRASSPCEFQPGCACGCVAAEAICTMEQASRRPGGEWSTVDLSGAISIDAIREQYRWLEEIGGRGDVVFSFEEFASGGERPRARAEGLWTYYLDSVEVGHLLALAKNPRLRAHSHYNTDQGNRATLSCPVTSRDDAQLRIARDIRKMMMQEPGKSTGVKFLISNTGTHLDHANHWFAVAYEIKRK